MPAHVANALSNYSLPSKRKDYFPRLKQDYNRRSDGTLEIVRREYTGGHRGDFTVAKDGAFSFAVPFTEGPGVYTVVVWVRRAGVSMPISASNVSIRVDGAPGQLRASAASR